MKITNEGIIHSIETRRIHYSITNGTLLLPKSIKFELEYFSNSILPETIQSLSISEWFERMLEYKIVIGSSIELSEEYRSFLMNTSLNKENAFLIVENTDENYLSRTLLQILQKLLPEITIKYLEYE